MAHALVEIETYDNPGGTTVPDDGDPRTVASVNGAFQTLADRTRFAYYALGGALRGALKMWCDGVTGAATKVWVSGVAGAAINARAVLVAGNTELTGALAASTRYYAYLGLSGGGAAQFHFTTTAPDPNGIWETGMTGALYLGTFATDGGGSVVPFRASGTPGARRYVYHAPAPIAVPNTGGAWQALALAAPVPPTARLVDLYCYSTPATTALGVRTPGTAAVLQVQIGGSFVAPVETDAGQDIEVYTTAAGASVVVMGFQE